MMQPHTIIGVFFVLLGFTFLIVQIVHFMGRDKSSHGLLDWIDPSSCAIFSISILIGFMFFDGTIRSTSPIGLWVLVIGSHPRSTQIRLLSS